MKWRVDLEFIGKETLIIEAPDREAAKKIAMRVSVGPVDNELHDWDAQPYDGKRHPDNDPKDEETA